MENADVWWRMLIFNGIWCGMHDDALWKMLMFDLDGVWWRMLMLESAVMGSFFFFVDE